MADESLYPIFCSIVVVVLKQVNTIVSEPYMDEPFHIPQAQAYCRGEYATWDPKITTPPGLYLLSLILKRVFLVKCNVSMLRLTPTLTLMLLPLALTRLLAFHKRVQPPSSVLSPTFEAMALSAFPLTWFYGFLYYTEVPSLLSVVMTVMFATKGWHWGAAVAGMISCTFRQTNIVWVLYAYATSQLMHLRFRRAAAGQPELPKLHDPLALEASPGDLIQSIKSAPKVIFDLLPAFLPYTLVLAAFGAFVVWNGGIVLEGDKVNHTPVLHVPQLYYFVAAATFFGWPVLISGPGGAQGLVNGVRSRMRVLATTVTCGIMCMTVNLFTIHHPFLLSDNRHYTFYVWRRIFMLHPLVPYLLVPIYLACTWAWFLRISHDQTLLQTLLLPAFVIPTLLPTPLLEPRYFLIPYVLMRAQVDDVPESGVFLETGWYAVVNAVTMSVFLYLPREGVGRFMW
ncbi:glycosyltransferase family 59 protein [Hypholoma sublateritium FD-334 SS-4]|uniref:Dol-P-Glc:Glc(2)Man(9)GlcNAc(2)-PP-Dol alpha-1,2-glucosyltransferase n=1 Tax=Hypholoma sublateritium (strain FD-334 SS-4) TaxID=945553 RepID=A0A0D2LEW0_HYPSF|nr:glycosyltransferase family 59 protein [Hypholoma sublateritium FD-334 SS-4]